MAQLAVTVPDNLTDDLVAAIAWALAIPEPPTTPAAKLTLAQEFLRRRAREVLADHKAALAAQSARATVDTAAGW